MLAASDEAAQQLERFSRRAVDLAESRNAKEPAAAYLSRGARTNALFSDCRQLKDVNAKALAITRSSESLVNTAFALALCGEASQAESLVDELTKRFPGNTFVNTT